MALDSNTTWGKNVADAIVAIGVTAGTEVTSTDLETVWAAIKGEDISQLGKANVAAGTFVDHLATPIAGIGGPVT